MIVIIIKAPMSPYLAEAVIKSLNKPLEKFIFGSPKIVLNQ